MVKRILITGGAGYIGSMMTEYLLEKEYEVTCLDRFYFGMESIQTFISDSNYEFIQKDIRHIKVKDLENFDVIVDLAGISNDPACDLDEKLTESINHQGTVNVAKSAKEAGVKRYIMASSCSIYGASDGIPLTEESEKHPVSLYAKAKIDAEKDILNLCSEKFSVTFLRLSTVFGLSYRMRFDLIINIMTMYAATKGKIMILGGGKQWRPLVHVKDVARAFHYVIEAQKDKINGEAFNVGSNNQNYQVYQVANIIKQTIPEKIDIEVAPDDPDKRNYNVNFNKMNITLGYVTKFDIQHGIMEVYNAISSGVLDLEDLKTVTVKYYKYLIEANKILEKIKINGNLF